MKNVNAVITQIRASALALSGLADALEGKEVKSDEVKSEEVKSEKVEKVKSEEVKKDEVKKSDEVKDEEENKPEKAYTFEEVRTFLTLKSREGKTEAVRAMLQAHGAATLSSLKEEDYAEVMKEAEGL